MRSRAEHPQLEIESCASGGARVDLGILDRTDRVWTSDSLDPLERLTNQRYTGLVVPPELMGMHLTSPVVHASRRTVSLEFSGAVALFGHFGIEWDLTAVDEATREGICRVGAPRQATASVDRDRSHDPRRRDGSGNRRAWNGRGGRIVRRLHDHADRDIHRVPRRPCPPARPSQRQLVSTCPSITRRRGDDRSITTRMDPARHGPHRPRNLRRSACARPCQYPQQATVVELTSTPDTRSTDAQGGAR